MGKIKAEIKFSFAAVLSVVLCTDTEGTAVLCIICCLLHETGHIIPMMIEKNPPEKIIFRGGGIKLKGGSWHSIFVILGGCIFNFLLFSVFYFLFGGYRLRLFGVLNLLTGLFNLLPVQPLDGYRLLEKAVLKYASAEKAENILKVSEIFSCILIIPFIIIFFIGGKINFSSVIFLFYLFAVDILENL